MYAYVAGVVFVERAGQRARVHGMGAGVGTQAGSQNGEDCRPSSHYRARANHAVLELELLSSAASASASAVHFWCCLSACRIWMSRTFFLWQFTDNLSQKVQCI